MTRLRIGVVADDFTGATDVASMLVRGGLRTVQLIGVPEASAPLQADTGAQFDAVVVALKSRTIAPADAVAQSIAAWRWLRAAGASQCYFKYCSTFDSTPKGNIGPVTEALMDDIGAEFTVVTPAFPENKRSIFNGYLFAGGVPLNESGMQNHPLTPMTDANLVRVMQAQCRRKVGLIDYTVVARGAAAIHERIAALQRDGVQIAIVDAINNDDLVALGRAVESMPLVTAGSGLALGLAAAAAPGERRDEASRLPPAGGRAAVISGSCSVATNRQVQHHIGAGRPAFQIEPERLLQPDGAAQALTAALDWFDAQASAAPVLIYSTAEPAQVKSVQQRYGIERVGAAVEATLASIAKTLVGDRGVARLVVAGGETAGACVQALGVDRLAIGAAITPGVPWCYAQPKLTNRGLHLALKSGNFGADDFFVAAFDLLK